VVAIFGLPRVLKKGTLEKIVRKKEKKEIRTLVD